MRCSMKLDGVEITADIPPETLLLDFVREHTTAPKEGCGVGVCGACSVLIDEEPRSACLTLAVMADGREVLTAQGIAERDAALAASFARHEAMQCGICTPGQLVAAEALLRSEPHPDKETVRSWMAGNLCRCTGYRSIVEAVQDGTV